jgi:hypothetical protein
LALYAVAHLVTERALARRYTLAMVALPVDGSPEQLETLWLYLSSLPSLETGSG